MLMAGSEEEWVLVLAGWHATGKSLWACDLDGDLLAQETLLGTEFALFVFERVGLTVTERLTELTLDSG